MKLQISPGRLPLVPLCLYFCCTWHEFLRSCFGYQDRCDEATKMPDMIKQMLRCCAVTNNGPLLSSAGKFFDTDSSSVVVSVHCLELFVLCDLLPRICSVRIEVLKWGSQFLLHLHSTPLLCIIIRFSVQIVRGLLTSLCILLYSLILFGMLAEKKHRILHCSFFCCFLSQVHTPNSQYCPSRATVIPVGV